MTSFGNLPAGSAPPAQNTGIAAQRDDCRNKQAQGTGFEDLFNDLLCGSEGPAHHDTQSVGKPGALRRSKQRQSSLTEAADTSFAAGFPGSLAAQGSASSPDLLDPSQNSTPVANSEADAGDQNAQPGPTSADPAPAADVPGKPVPETPAKVAGAEISAVDTTAENSAETNVETGGELVPDHEDKASGNIPQISGNQRFTAKQQAQNTSPTPALERLVVEGAEPHPGSAGTTSARTDSEMQERSSQNKFAGGSWKPATAAEFLVHIRHSESNELPQGGNKPHLDAPPVVDLSGAMRLPAKDEVIASNGPDPFRANRLDHVFQTVLDYLPAIRHSPGGSLNVVLRPDADTEISLRLAATNGSFEVSAKCDRGDFALLNSHWPELRVSLQQHGVRLLELANSTNTATGGHTNTNFSNSSRHGASQSSAQPDDFLSTPPNSPAGAHDTRGVSHARRATQQKGLLELWA